MKHASWWSAAIATLGSVVVVAATLLHYIHAQASGTPGGYLSIALGSIGVGVLAGISGYFSLASPQRRVLGSLLLATIVGLVTAGILTATLIWAFGS